MTFERHQVLSANFIKAVEWADAERAECMRRLLFFRWSRRGGLEQTWVAAEPKAPVSAPQAHWQNPLGNVIR
jgi:hypothetical protein